MTSNLIKTVPSENKTVPAVNAETAALICRVSTREQEDGYSLDAQENLLREFSTRYSFNVLLVHRFSETASKHTRRQKFHAFMAEVAQRKVRHIVVEKVDRLTRSGFKEAVMIDDWLEADGARYLHCVKDGIDLHKFSRSGDKLNWGMRVVLAKNYTDNLREEVRKSMDTMLRKGIWPSKTPNGYIRDKTHPQGPIQPDPTRAPLVKLLFQLYDSGDWSVHHLVERLFEEGYRTRQGRKLQASQIHSMLQDPFYTGKMLFEGKLWEGIHPPLISMELFHRVQRRLRRQDQGGGAITFQRHDHLYRGLARCACCGKALTWEIQKGRVYGYCKGYKTCSERASIREDILEKELLPSLEAFRLTSPRLAQWLRKALKEAHADEQVTHESSRVELQQLLARAEHRLSRLLDMRIDNVITEEDFNRKRDELGSEKSLLLERMSHVSERQNSYLDNVSTLIGLTQDAAERFCSARPEQKRVLLQHVFRDFTVSPSGVVVEYTDLFGNLLAALHEAKSSKAAILAKTVEVDFELEKSGSDKEKEGTCVTSRSSWWAIQNKFRTLICESPPWKHLISYILQHPKEDMEAALHALSLNDPNAS